MSSDANYQREAVANGDDTERGDGTYCIDNDCDTSRIVRPIINSLSVPGVRHVSQNGSPNVQHRHKIASFACNFDKFSSHMFLIIDCKVQSVLYCV